MGVTTKLPASKIITVSPTANTTYTVTCYNIDSNYNTTQASSSVTVNVAGSTPPTTQQALTVSFNPSTPASQILYVNYTDWLAKFKFVNPTGNNETISQLTFHKIREQHQILCWLTQNLLQAIRGRLWRTTQVPRESERLLLAVYQFPFLHTVQL